MKAQIRDGKFPFRSKEEGKEWKLTWISAPGFNEIIEEVCELTERKALPFFLSIQAPEDYLELLETIEQEGGFSVSRDIETIRSHAESYGARFLPLLSEYITNAEEGLRQMIAQDVDQYDEQYQR